MRVIRASWVVSVVVACTMMVSCERSEGEEKTQRRAKQALGESACPPVECGDTTNLTTTAITSVPLGSNFVMIPRSTWDERIAAAGGNLGALQAVNELREQAVRAASTANDPMASGVFSSDAPPAIEGGEFTASDILVVVEDAQLDPNSNRIYATNYFISAIGLTGSSDWMRRGLSIAVQPTMMSGGGRCCGPENIGEQLEPTLGEPGTEPPECTPGPYSYCSGWNTRLRPAGSLNHDQRRSQSGRPIIMMRMFSLSGQAMHLSFAGPLGGLAAGEIDCTQAVPTCLESPGITAFPWGGWEAELPHGNSQCAPSGNFGGTNVPPWCTIATGSNYAASGDSVGVVRPAGGGLGLASCDGQCPECSSLDAVSNTGVIPRQCWLRTQTGDICEHDSVVKMKQLQDQINARFDYNTMVPCATPQDLTARCGGCQSVGGPGASGVFECGRCTKNVSTGIVSCDYYSAYENGAAACPEEADLICRPQVMTASPVGEVQARTSKEIGSGVPATLQPVSLLPELPCTVGCGGASRVGEHMPSTAPRGGAVAETAGEAPKVNAAEKADKKEGENSEIPNDGQQNASDKPKADGDPVTLFDGALVLNTSDLSFPGPSRPLEFTRSYNSRTNIRSPLGSNWTHNFAARLIPLKKQNLPAWVDPYCMGTPTVTTCVMLVSGDSSRIFYLDQATGMYMPQAGSMATVRGVGGDAAGAPEDIGWILRQPDGSQLTFDLRGYLRRDVDRFGNGFTLHYELTAAGVAMEAVCPQVPFVRADGEWGAVVGPTGVNSEMQGCVLLYGLTGFSDMPTFSSTTVVTDAMFGSASSDPSVAAARAAVVASQPTFGTPLPSGQAHQRLTHVTDDLGRVLDFEYFTSGVNIGLLQRVEGPAAAIVEFTYANDPSASAGLNERFLVAAKRVDGSGGAPLVQAAGNRGYEYEYAWQRSDQMPTDLPTADAAYRAYFGNIYNCGGLVKQACSDKWSNTIQFADIAALAAEPIRRLYAEAADNITTVRVHSYAPAASRIESETRYASNVYDPGFDRALAQRWGGEVDSSLPAVQHPATSFSWQNANLPLATFEYAGAVPKVGSGGVIGDETDDFLPVALRSRYALEPDLLTSSSVQSSLDKGLLLPPSPPLAAPAPFAGVRVPVALGAPQILENTVRQPCGYHLLPDARAKLPGYKPSLDYYDTQLPTADLATPGVSYAQEIRRSYLSCETLALAETYDVRHNDLASTWSKALDGGFVVESMTGRRKHTAANANRVCQWVRYTDRDGDVHYSGLNFQGRPLVNAVRVMAGATEKWKVAETLYNADGNVLSQRRTTDVAWTPSAGDTRYTYMETVVPAGSLGTTRPQHWTKRGNVIRVWERPRGGSVQDEVDGTSTLVTSLGRYTQYAYEPFYNQVRLVIRGNVINDGTDDGADEPFERTVLLQDWQEYGASDPELQRLLWMAHLWGGQLSTDSPPDTPRDLPTDGSTFLFDWDAVKGQLNVELFDTDLNGDDVEGSTTGVPVLIRAEVGLSLYQREDTYLRWSPAGKPYIIDAPGGARTLLEYYARAGAQSGAADLTASGTINGGNAGFLARVTRERDWPANVGPPRASCPSLPRQYQFLLTSCAQNPGAQLSALGLSSEAVDGILNAPSGVTTSVNYNLLGHVSGVMSHTGLRSVITTDTDGRTLQTDVYPAGSSTRDTYTVQTLDAFKRATRSQRFANSGQLLGDEVRTFDNADQLLTKCHASAVNGCNAGQTENVKSSWVYTREGAVFRSIDAAGLVAEYTRDGRKWVTKKTLTSPNPTDAERQETIAYDDDGHVETTTWGSQSPLTEMRIWDGLGRLASVIDTQERTVEYRYSKQGVLTSSLLVGDDAGRTTYAHDGFGRTTIASKNGRTLAAYNRLPGGLAYAVSADGRGTRYVTYDAAGEVAWAENSVGDMSVFTEKVSPAHLVTSSRIRQQGALTTGSVSLMDALGRPASSREVGGALSRETLFAYDEAGNLEQTIAPDTAATTAGYDLLGRMTELRQQREWNASAYEISSYTYNSRGLLESTIDPMGYETVQHYDGFGAPSVKTGPQSVSDEWTYDEHGRKLTHTVGGQIDLGYAYDSLGRLERVTRGDPQTPGVPELASFKYDALGRVEFATRRNLGLSPHLAEGDRTVELGRTYDNASRRYTETVTVGQGKARTVTTEWLFNGTWTRAVSLPSGRRQEHLFDTEGRELQQLRVSGEVSEFNWLDELLQGSASYFPGGAVNGETQFDALAQPVAWSWSANDPLMNVSVVRDNMGRIAGSGIDFFGTQTQGTSWRGYVYDAMGRISVAHEGAATPSGIKPHKPTADTGVAVEAAGNSVSAARWAYTREASVGGLVSIADGIHPPRFETTENFTSPNGTPTARTDGHRLDKYMVGKSRRQAAHDGAGRMISDDEQQFVFDDLEALALVNDSGGNLKEAYLYDGQGRLTARLDASAKVVESLVHDGVQMAESFDSGGDLRWSASWGPGIDNLVSLTTQDTEYFTLDDGKANIVGWVSNQSGRLEAFAEYTPEGRGKYTDDFNGTVCEEVDDVRCTKPFDLPFGFHSAYSSSTTGLVYFRNRWYSPEAAQWLSHDPLGFVDSFNLYAFNAFDSVNFFDPMGLEKKGLASWEDDPDVYPDPTSTLGVGLYIGTPLVCGALCKLNAVGGGEFRQGPPKAQNGDSPGDGIAIPVVPSNVARRPQLPMRASAGVVGVLPLLELLGIDLAVVGPIPLITATVIGGGVVGCAQGAYCPDSFLPSLSSWSDRVALQGIKDYRQKEYVAEMAKNKAKEAAKPQTPSQIQNASPEEPEPPREPDREPGKSAKETRGIRPERGYLGSKKHGVSWKEGAATAKSTGTPQGQWGSADDLDFGGQKAATLGPGKGDYFPLPPGHSSTVWRPDGTQVPASQIWVRNNGTGTFHGYPLE